MRHERWTAKEYAEKASWPQKACPLTVHISTIRFFLFKTRRLGSSDLNLWMVLSYCSLMDVHLNWMMIPRQKKQLFFSNKVMKIASIAEVSKEQMKVLYTQTQLQFSATFLFLGRREVFNFYLTWDNTQLDIGGERQTRDIMCAASAFVLTSALITRPSVMEVSP